MRARDISHAILSQRHELVSDILACQHMHQPDLQQRYSETYLQKTVQDIHHHLTYLSEAVAVERPALFADYVAWIRGVLNGYGVPEEDLRVNINCLADTLRQRLPAEMQPGLTPYLEVAAAQFSAPLTVQRSCIDRDMPYASLARDYLDALLEGDRYRASRLILDAVDTGANVQDVYLQVFQPVQHEVGRLWQINEISVAHEHFITAATQLVMSQLYPRIFTMDRSGNTLVATCVSGELHEIGIRMVADFFEMDGWDTFYLGANTPVASIVQTMIERRADVLAISATMTLHISAVERLIDAVRASAARDACILVGGYPFNIAADLWQQIGADGSAVNAEAAIHLANDMIGKAG